MTAERWQRVKEVFEAALERAPAERPAFLDQVCDGDDALRREVQSLLAAFPEGESFMEKPAAALAAKTLAGAPGESLVGQVIGHYRVTGALGSGGMGEVYLAQDIRLGRPVALKLLPVDLASDGKRLRRFLQEAKLASALNHPNVCTIYEVGETEQGQPFIAMEYIEGQTLSTKINGQPLALADTLQVAIEIADALSEAHAKGIIHRDLKPANILINGRQQAKVLDFGLAKLTAPLEPSAVGELPTQPNTEPGTVMGTPPYMSPEQALGKEADLRTDIFSLGVVVYEMATGRLPFTGATVTEMLDRIVHAQPEAIARFNYNAPAELERIVRKCLEKERGRRYQSARELLVDLKNLKRDSDAGGAQPRAYDAGIAFVQAGKASAPNALRTTVMESSPGWRQASASRRGVAIALMLALLIGGLGYALLARKPGIGSQPEIKSLAILPLKSLDAGENYMGLGIADAVIRKINQTGGLIVRPTSAVRHYLNEDTDALTAARQLNADAVLEGNVQRADDRLRVSVNLLRTGDGTSLWVDNFDMRMSDIFTIQDTVAQQVATRLRLRLNPEQQARFTKRSTANPVAYEYYMKGAFALDLHEGSPIAKPQMEAAIDFFKKAIEVDPDYALAHARLAYTYAWKALFIEQESVWVERAKEEINRAEALDPQLAETHLARSLLLWSAYEGWQIEAAVRELLLAQQLDPNVGHAELASLYEHIGLEDSAAQELQRALDLDPTSEWAKSQILNLYFMGSKYDEWLAAYQKLYPGNPAPAWYFIGKGRLDEAQKALEEEAAKEPNDPYLPKRKALLFALKGDFRAAEAEIPSILSKHSRSNPNYHHATYDIACVYALAGKCDEAVKWLKETASTGFPNYPLFERDPYLNRIRKEFAFVQFMTELKNKWEGYKREFG